MSYTIEQMSAEFTKHHLNPDGAAPWPFRPVLHHFTAPDKGGPHDHPWGFTSFVLHGSYVEKVYTPQPDGTWTTEMIHRRAGTAHTVVATHIHELVYLPDGECWTMVLAQPWERESRFWRFDENGIASRAWNEAEFTPVEKKPADNRNTIIILDPVNKPWIAYCEVCGQGYENWAGSTPCCGSVCSIQNPLAHAKD